MRIFTKILFWTYFLIATLSFIAVIIYSINNFPQYLDKERYKSKLSRFEKYFQTYAKNDSTFYSLFNNSSQIVLDFINESEKFNENINYTSTLIKIDNNNLRGLDSLFKKWPTKYQEIAKDNLFGIFILDSTRFSGLTQIIQSTGDKFIIFLKAKLFNQTPNDWITENSTLSLKDEYKSQVKCILFDKSQNIPIKTVEHVLLHEFSHVFSFLYHEAPLPNGEFKGKKGFYPLIESCFEGGYISYEMQKSGLENFAILSKQNLLNSQKLEFEKFKELNKILSNSFYPTPYSAKDGIELVAENLTFYIHQNYLNQQYLMVFDKKDTIYFGKHIDHNYIDKIIR